MKLSYNALPGAAEGYAAEDRSRRANRRRLIVFVIAFALVAVIGLIYVFSRPAIYQATVRLNFVPAGAARNGGAASDTPFSLRDEVEFLTSRTLLAKVAERLKAHGSEPAPTTGVQQADPASALQAMLSANQVEGTNIVLLKAHGGEPAFLAALLDALVATYQSTLAERYDSASAGTLADVADEAKKLDAAVIAKRQEADAFRARYNIVSLERDENQILSEVRGTTAAINAANDKVTAAEAHLGALQEAVAAGKTVARPRDAQNMQSLEQQAVAIRAELREVGRTFTEQYMQIDPRIRSMRERLGEIEQQIVAQRKAGSDGALQEAREDVSSARAAVASLRRQLSTNQQSVQGFTSRFNEYRALQEELGRIEQLRQKAVERQAALEAEESARMPKVEAVEAAAVPTSPASPLYGRDAAIALFAALVAGLSTMGIVELFNRPPRQAAAVIVQQAWSPRSGPDRGPAALEASAPHGYIDASPSPAPTAVLAAPSSLPRELTTAEQAALIDAASGEVRAAIALLLVGLTRAEVVAARGADLDRASGTLRVGTAIPRSVGLPDAVVGRLPSSRSGEAPLVAGRGGAPMSEAELDAALLYAAHDAGIDDPDEVTSTALHHTYVAFLVRQGVRFAELVDLVGDLRPDALADYRRLAPVGPRQSVDAVERVMPVLRDAPAA